MIPNRQILEQLLLSGVSFYVYGPIASGKTTFLTKLFKQTGVKYIRINCAFAEKKHNFLKLLNQELLKYIQETKLIKQSSEFKLSTPQAFDSWLNQMKSLQKNIWRCLDGLYLFMDNSQEIKVGQKFLASFYEACKNQFQFKINFVFCGNSFGIRTYVMQEPFKSLLSFCFKKPTNDFQQTIRKVIKEVINKGQQLKQASEVQIAKVQKLLTGQIKAGFQMVQTNLKKISRIARIIVESLLPEIIGPKFENSVIKLIHNNQIKSRIIKVIQFQNLAQHQLQDKFLEDSQRTQLYWKKIPYYPNLIMTSIFLADQYTESDDKRRFKDYRKILNSKKKTGFKKYCWGTLPRHNIQRIIAIGEVIESQAKQNNKESKYNHHSLDYYSSFQYLNDQHMISFVGKYTTWGVGKVQGKPNEDEAHNFLKAAELKDSQFMST